MDPREKAMRCTGSKSTLRLTTPVAMLIGVAILAILAVLPAAAVVFPVDPAGLARAIAAQERHTDQLLAVTGVVGTAVGVRGDGKHVVKIFTETAGVAGLPQALDGIPVQVQVTGRIFARHHRPGHDGGPKNGGDDPPPPDGNDCPDTTARAVRPVCIGISTGHPAITAGTIGCRVTDGTDVYALSNNHVYANQNAASIGDAVIQPGTFDGGISPDDNIGTLYDFVEILFDGSDNTIDAAIALSSTANLGNATPSDGYGTPKSATATASINMKVMKYGRTTGQTKGRVSAINATVNINYGTARVARFVNQIIIEPGNFSAGGDSGSLIVSNERGAAKREPVGLLFAGSFFMTVANPIDDVLARFGVTIDGE